VSGVSTSAFVRSARLADVDHLQRLQVASWSSAYESLLPAQVLRELRSEEAAERFREQWRQAVEHPPTSRHRVLVATQDRETVGFAALGPAQDPDRWPATYAELYALHVDPGHVGQGHGSRLLNAAVDHLVDAGFRVVLAWVPEQDNPQRGFLEHSNWRPDGARRELDMGVPVGMVRLHAGIGEELPG
jgi:GNAT superfamily N-acetyltransferase